MRVRGLVAGGISGIASRAFKVDFVLYIQIFELNGFIIHMVSSPSQDEFPAFASNLHVWDPWESADWIIIIVVGALGVVTSRPEIGRMPCGSCEQPCSKGLSVSRSLVPRRGSGIGVSAIDTYSLVE